MKRLADERIELYFYCRSQVAEVVKHYFLQEFGQDITARIKTEKDNLVDIQTYLSTIYAIPSCIRNYPHITCFTVVHDVIPLLFPYYFNAAVDFHSWFAELVADINKEDFYFAVSSYTKQDFVRHVPAIDSEKITVIRLAADARFHPEHDMSALRQIKAKYNIPAEKKYLFSLCTLEPRKNLFRALNAFIAFIEKNQIDDMVYVLGGGMWKNFQDMLEREVPGYQRYADRILRTGYLPDDDLAVLLSNAEWFVYTSQYEGFGMPPLEAMQCGCPVIVSNNSSLPEVVGDAGLMIDYDNMEQHVEAYETYYFKPELRQANIEKGLARATLFSWDSCEDTMVRTMMEVEQRRQTSPLVTVVTVTRNLVATKSEAQFRACMESVGRQKYNCIEHLVVDCASDDGTAVLLEEYASSGKITLIHESSSDVCVAMNTGVARAKGEYISFLASDDIFATPDSVGLSIGQLLKTRADYLSSDVFVRSIGDDADVWEGHLGDMLLGTMYAYRALWFKTSMLREQKGFDVSCRSVAEADLLMRLYAAKCSHTYLHYSTVEHCEKALSQDEIRQIRLDHSSLFYNRFGEKLGMTPFDCYVLWCSSFLSELPANQQTTLIAKVPSDFGLGHLINQLSNNIATKQTNMFCNSDTKFYLFGFVPVMRRKSYGKKVKYLLCNILPLMKIVNYHGKRKYYFLGFLPVWKVRTRLL